MSNKAIQSLGALTERAKAKKKEEPPEGVEIEKGEDGKDVVVLDLSQNDEDWLRKGKSGDKGKGKNESLNEAADPAQELIDMLAEGKPVFDNLKAAHGRVAKSFDEGQKRLKGSKRLSPGGDFETAAAHLKQVRDNLKDLAELSAGLEVAITKQLKALGRREWM